MEGNSNFIGRRLLTKRRNSDFVNRDAPLKDDPGFFQFMDELWCVSYKIVRKPIFLAVVMFVCESSISRQSFGGRWTHSSNIWKSADQVWQL